MGKTSMSTASVRDNAAELLSQAKAFKGAFDALYQAIDTLGKTYTGEDGVNFIARINGHKESFEDIYKKLEKAADTFEASAAAYEKIVNGNKDH